MGPKRYKSKLLLVKPEAAAGMAEALDAADAIKATGIEITPLEADTVSREEERPYFGGQEQVNANVRSRIRFAVEFAGGGAPGTAPAWGALVMACGMAQALTAPAQAWQAATEYDTGDLASSAGKTWRSRVDNNQGNRPAANANWEEVADPPESAVYSPITGGAMTVTIALNIDGILQVIPGCRGTWSLQLGTGAIPRVTFDMIGAYQRPADQALINPNYPAVPDAIIPSNEATPIFELLGVAGLALSELTVEWGAEAVRDERIGRETETQIVDRVPTGRLSLDTPAVADLPIVDRARESAKGALAIVHGTEAGNIIRIDMPRIALAEPSYQERQNIWQVQTTFSALPVDGNDELVLTVT